MVGGQKKKEAERERETEMGKDRGKEYEDHRKERVVKN